MELRTEIFTHKVLSAEVGGGCVYGTLQPAPAGSLYVAEWGGNGKRPRVAMQQIADSKQFLLDYANLATTPTDDHGHVIELLTRYGFFGNPWVEYGKPATKALTAAMRRSRQTASRRRLVPYTLAIEHMLKPARECADYLQGLRAVRSPGALSDWHGRELTHKLRFHLRERGRDRYSGITLGMDMREDRSFVLTATTSTLEEGLLLALCDHLTSDYKQCVTCGKWFAAVGEQQHCSKKCRTKASVYKFRAVEDVIEGKKTSEKAAKHYNIDQDELAHAVRHRECLRKQRSGRE